MPEGFLVFYEKFHRDSLFQLDHIQWPLQGEAFSPVLEAGKSNKEMRQWTRDSWVMHHPLDLGPSNLARTWMPVGSGMVVERVCEKISKLCLERRFAKNTSGEWELIYYIAY